MEIALAQREMRVRFAGGFYGQFVSGALWLASAALATWSTPRAAIVTLVAGGFFIFPATALLIRLGGRGPLSAGNTLAQLGMQAAFVLPLSMPLLVPVGLYRLEWFYPAFALLLGAHYVPFVFLYGMRLFAGLAAALVAGAVVIAIRWPANFPAAAWYTGVVLLAFAVAGRAVVAAERR